MNPENIVVGIDDNKIVGVVILTNTGMKDFIPENILVYIAVDNSQRGKGYGKKLMQKQYQLLKEI
jgi:predicted N-acetyltransferase YhbS